MQKQHVISIVLSLSMLVTAVVLMGMDDGPAEPSERASSPAPARDPARRSTTRLEANAKTHRPIDALAAPASAPKQADVDPQDPFLAVPTHNPMLPPIESFPEGAGPAPGQSTEAWLEEEFARERERQTQDWEAFDAEDENSTISAPLQAEIIANFDASMPTLSGLRDYEVQCRGGRCMITIEWERLADAQNAMEQLIAQEYPDCARAIYLTPDGLGTEDAPYEQLISMRCEVS
ncbi:MAG: hypothetical protein HC927_07795 [Deltaproteobacteria bacterium]|nr:hypothetical protein [Deltaproteobacteria bacterium]